MAQAIGALRVDLSASAAQFKKDLGKAGKAGSKFGGNMKRLAKGTTVALAAIGVAAAAVGAALVKLTKDSLQAADRFAKLSAKTGETVEFLSAFAHAAELSGSSTEELGTGLGRLARTMSDAQAGLSTATRSFDQLELSVANADGTLRPVRDIVLEVADRFAGMTDATKKAALAQELFGRAGVNLIPLLNQGSAAIRAQMEEAELLGIVFTTKAAKAAEEFNDNMARLGKFLIGIRNTIAAGLLPVLRGLVDSMLLWVKANAETIRSRILEWAQRFAVVIANVFDVVVSLAGIFRDLAPVLVPIGQLFFRLGQIAWNAFAVTASGAITILLAGIQTLVRGADAVARAFGKEGFSKTIDALDVSIASFADRTTKNWSDLMTSLGLAAADVPKVVPKQFSEASKLVEGIVKDFTVTMVAEGDKLLEQQIAQQNKMVTAQAKANLERFLAFQEMLKDIDLADKTSAEGRLAISREQEEKRLRMIEELLRDGLISKNEFEEAETAILAKHIDIRNKLERESFDNFKVIQDRLSVESKTGLDQRLEQIRQDTARQIVEINKLEVMQIQKDRLITHVHQAELQKRQDANLEFGGFWVRQLQDLAASNVFTLSSITQSFVGAIDQWRQNLGDFQAFWENMQSVLFQATLNFVIKWIAQQALMALTSERENARILVSHIAAEQGKTASTVAQEGARITVVNTGIAAMVSAAGISLAATVAAASGSLNVLTFMLNAIVAFMVAVAAAVSFIPIIGQVLAGLILAGAAAAAIIGNAAIEAARAGMGAIALQSVAGVAIPLEEGGFTLADTFAFIHKNEAVIPLDDPRAMRALGTGQTLILEIDRRRLASLIIPETEHVVRMKLGARI